jgi:SAM-dependent methyltransferase
MVSGRDFYDEPGVRDRYVDSRVPSGLSDPVAVMHDPAVYDVLGSVAGLRIVDLGCGDGRIGRWMIADECASYLGIDASAGMLAAAREELQGSSAQFVQAPIEQVELEREHYDLIVSLLALHYLEAVDDVFCRCRGALVRGGRLVISVPHPVLTAPQDVPQEPRTSWTVDDYFAPGARLREWLGGRVVWYHRTVEMYVAALADAGMALVSLRECPPVPSAFQGDDAELARRTKVPAFLILEARRAE